MSVFNYFSDDLPVIDIFFNGFVCGFVAHYIFDLFAGNYNPQTYFVFLNEIPVKEENKKPEPSGDSSPQKLEEEEDTVVPNTSQSEKKRSLEDDEIAKMFEEEHNIRNRAHRRGVNDEKEPLSQLTIPSGNYVTFKEVEKDSEKETNNNIPRLKRSDELEIMHTFNYIRGRNYREALGIAFESGYDLHPVYINKTTKNPRKTYSEKVIGVSIQDNFYDFYGHNPSKNAVITSVVDVGGQDIENRGNPSGK